MMSSTGSCVQKLPVKQGHVYGHRRLLLVQAEKKGKTEHFIQDKGEKGGGGCENEMCSVTSKAWRWWIQGFPL